MSTSIESMSWAEVEALLTDEDRVRLNSGLGPDLSGRFVTAPSTPASGGLLAAVRRGAAKRAAGAVEQLAEAFTDLLQVPGLPAGQREVLSCAAFAFYRTVAGTRSTDALKALLPRVEVLIAAAITESARRSAAEPSPNIAVPDDVERLCRDTADRTFGILHVVHAAHFVLQGAAAAVSGGSSVLAFPVTWSIHAFVFGTVATLSCGMAELYGAATFLGACRYPDPGASAVRIVSSAVGRVESRAALHAVTAEWAISTGDPARELARRWLTKSFGTGVPVIGKHLQVERASVVARELRALTQGGPADGIDPSVAGPASGEPG